MMEEVQEKLDFFINDFDLQEILKTIEIFVKEHTFTLIIAVIILIILECIIRTKGRHSKSTKNFGSHEYRNDILTSMPSQTRADFTYLYKKLDELNNLINQVNYESAQQKENVREQIDTRIRNAQTEIENNWRIQQQKKEYYRCIGVHYASFTLANSIKREQEKIRDSFVAIKNRCDQYSTEIESLNTRISTNSGTKRYELMQIHQETCAKHKRLSQMKNVLGSRNTQYLNLVKAQNKKTAQYRDYIIANFGAKGRAWGRRIQKKKMDQTRK